MAAKTERSSNCRLVVDVVEALDVDDGVALVVDLYENVSLLQKWRPQPLVSTGLVATCIRQGVELDVVRVSSVGGPGALWLGLHVALLCFLGLWEKLVDVFNVDKRPGKEISGSNGF